MADATRRPRNTAGFRLFTTAALALLLSACAATQNVQQIETLESVGENPKVLLMPPDIRYYLVTAGGVPEPHAEWTEAARKNFSVAVQGFAEGIGANLEPLDDADLTPLEVRYRKLHEAVGFSVMTHHFGTLKLPNKNKTFDWSLGPGVQELADEYDADYALFVFYRDEQASGGRIALAVIAAAAGGYASAGSEHGFASLVDLKSGDIVWFNVVGAGTGELRDEAGAEAAVRTLFKDLPARQEL
jgi:hypothetical protein